MTEEESAELLEIVRRIEKKMDADAEAIQDLKELEARIRAKIKVEDDRIRLMESNG